MKKQILHLKHLVALLTLVVLSAAGLAYSQTGQTPTMTPNDPDITRRQLADFDVFLDNHPEVASQLQKDPSLMDSREFVENHPALQEFLRDHPNIREEIKENPNAFMRREDRYERHEGDSDRRGDRDITRGELAAMDGFLDQHPEIAEQLRKDPSLIDKPDFIEHHPRLKEFLAQHPELREEFKENPNAFMHMEERFDRRENDRDVTRWQLANVDQFLDSHPEIAEQVRKDPSLVDNQKFVTAHPALQDYLQQHPEIRQELAENPNAFMRKEDRFDRREDRDVTRWQLANVDQFLDSHPEIAEQVRKDPSLLDNQKFVTAHPALQDYLQQHPEIRQELAENPNAFMWKEDRFDRREDRDQGYRDQDYRDRDPNRRELANFHQFLGEHSTIASQLAKNPQLAQNGEYIEQHPELQQYLQAHPGVQKELTANPQVFMNSVQQFNESATPGKGMTPKTPVLDPKPKP